LLVLDDRVATAHNQRSRFAAFVDRHILATIYAQCFGGKAGDRAGMVTRFISCQIF
jgi:hypothetical protein